MASPSRRRSSPTRRDVGQFSRAIRYRGILAVDPTEFSKAADLVPRHERGINPDFSMTNKGLRTNITLRRTNDDCVFMPLNCSTAAQWGLGPRDISSTPGGLSVSTYASRTSVNLYHVKSPLSPVERSIFGTVAELTVTLRTLRQRTAKPTDVTSHLLFQLLLPIFRLLLPIVEWLTQGFN